MTFYPDIPHINFNPGQTLYGKSIRTAFEAMEVEAKRVGLHIIEEKTKIMLLVKKPPDQRMSRLEMDPYNFEVVRSFTYLGSIINENQDEEEEVKTKIAAGNRAYFFIVRLIKSRLTGLKRVILRRILGPVCENGNWRRRKNGDLFGLYKECSISAYIRIQRLKWLGHVMRMSEERVAHKLYSYVPDGVRQRGRPKGRWRDALRRDQRQMRIPVTLTEDRERWLAAVEQAKGSLLGLLCQ
ncbi:uncharacterized protein [Halyomorpha halys]|uniref:uncharacterized protein n=1 Tax=Halyomorpha halys TaxID=286706 RepID=UPI0034D2A93C